MAIIISMQNEAIVYKCSCDICSKPKKNYLVAGKGHPAEGELRLAMNGSGWYRIDGSIHCPMCILNK